MKRTFVGVVGPCDEYQLFHVPNSNYIFTVMTAFSCHEQSEYDGTKECAVKSMKQKNELPIRWD